MFELENRINRVIHTKAFEETLERYGMDLFDFQTQWFKVSDGDFEKLPVAFKEAILDGEKEVSYTGMVSLVPNEFLPL